ncbi:MAG: TetR/AcrR family transcriptional regulator [Spirochaetaceae bacterium]|nr:TetR/AcrR family transcriptional regulator [Spirochaetaceae bacterium]
MTAVEKLAEERDELKNARIERILLSAFSLFSHEGIDAIAMTDIAKNAEIGVASLYRYFETKDEIAIRTAIWAWESQKNVILPLLKDSGYENKNGRSQLEEIFALFCKLYQNEPDFFRYIYFFDAYVVCQKISAERLSPYQTVIESVQEIIESAIHKGLEDGSISSVYRNCEKQLYYSLMHTLFSTSQKLSLSSNMLKMDKENDAVQQLKLLGEILSGGLK